MAWTASVTKYEKREGCLYVFVDYTDGSNTFQQMYQHWGKPQVEWLEKKVAERLEGLNGVDTTTVTVGPVPAPTPVTPPVENLDEKAFLRNLRKVERIKLLLDIGALKVTDQQVIDFVATVRSKLPTYWSLL